MTDEPLDPNGADPGEPSSEVLASAYLDGEATGDERALVETSTETLDEVRRFRDVRSVLAATAPAAPLAQREELDSAELDELTRNEAAEVAGDDVGSDRILPTEQIEGEAASDGVEDGGLFADESVAADTDSAADSSFDDTADDAAEEDLPDDAVQLAPGTEIELVELDSLEALADFGSLVVPFVTNAPPVPAAIAFAAPFDTCEARFAVGLLAIFLGLFALVLLLIGLTRGIQAALEPLVDQPRAVYISYFVIGGLLSLVGAILFRKRNAGTAS